MAPRRALTLASAAGALRNHYGPPAPLPTADPFELILWENVAYLASPERRREAFEDLKRTVGTTPERILEAEKILLFVGREALLAPDSNGLRVLARLGLVREEASYARTYAASRKVAESWPGGIETLQEAHLLLQQHGQTLCKRGAPRCEACPLEPGCVYARGAAAGRDAAGARKRDAGAPRSKR